MIVLRKREMSREIFSEYPVDTDGGVGGWPTSAQPSNSGCPMSRAFRDVGVCG